MAFLLPSRAVGAASLVLAVFFDLLAFGATSAAVGALGASSFWIAFQIRAAKLSLAFLLRRRFEQSSILGARLRFRSRNCAAHFGRPRAAARSRSVRSTRLARLPKTRQS